MFHMLHLANSNQAGMDKIYYHICQAHLEISMAEEDLSNSILFDIDEAPLSKINNGEDNETETEWPNVKNHAKHNTLLNVFVSLWGNNSEQLASGFAIMEWFLSVMPEMHNGVH